MEIAIPFIHAHFFHIIFIDQFRFLLDQIEIACTKLITLKNSDFTTIQLNHLNVNSIRHEIRM